MTNPVVKVEDFHKVYGNFIAVDGISFEVHSGEIFGLLGPNGAGKTSTLESLEGLRSPDSGIVQIMGIDPTRESRKIRNIIGVQLQSSGLPGSMRVDEAMKFFSAYHRVAPRYDLLERIGLAEKMSTQYQMLSTGQQRRLTLALAIAHNPPVVFLDEPTAGLDVHSRVELHCLMDELRAAGTTIILATHDMAEAEKMADRIAILLSGKIVASGTPRELTVTGAQCTKITVSTERSSLLNTRLQLPGVIEQVSKEEYIVYYSNDINLTVPAIISYLVDQGDSLVDLRVERPSLEERFLEITKAGGAI
ncbi:MAG TPA: ABC transporter ATP-binding protein [Candidatus Deferrimicrobium sp.]|nr:ABC transporter ATP-binding protein [Candidatus Deferrimicrobium sp.]